MASMSLAPHSTALVVSPTTASVPSRDCRFQGVFRCKLSSTSLFVRRPVLRRFRSCVCGVTSLAETEPLRFDPDHLGKLPAAQGLYAVYNKQGELQFVGMSRRISTSVQGHARDLPDLCGSVKVAVVEGVDRDGLRQAWQAWVEEHLKETGNVPEGNKPGNTTWTARKKPVKSDLKMKPSKDKELTISLEDLIGQVVKAYPVVAFIKGSRTAPQCGFSHRVLTLLQEQGVDYETVNVLDEEHNSGVREAVKSYSQWPTIPQVFVKGEFVGGADILSEMAESGEIEKLLAPFKTK